MSERFFPGFQFKNEASPLPALGGFIEVPYEERNQWREKLEPITLDELAVQFLEGPLAVMEIAEEDQKWTQAEVERDFSLTLAKMSDSLLTPRFSMQGRTTRFVAKNEMRPKTETDRQWLRERYGEYILDGAAGGCTRNPDGTFSIRIGYAGQEGEVARSTVLSVIAHEFGHSLGDQLDDALFEELKGYAFANLFFRYYHRVGTYRKFVSGLEDSNTHSVALFYLEQLMNHEITEEEILAHLTGKKFGMARPFDYQKKLVLP